VVARPGTKLEELTELVVAIRREADSTLHKLSHHSDEGVAAAGEHLPHTGRAAIERTPIPVTNGHCGDPIGNLGVIGCILGLRG
jgi:hypothetical protein